MFAFNPARKIKALYRTYCDEKLVQAQYDVVLRHLPLVYLILLVGVWSVALTFDGKAPDQLVFTLPVAFTLLGVARTIWWSKHRNKIASKEDALSFLKNTKRLSLLLAVSYTIWNLALFYYAEQEMQVNIAFYMAISGISITIFMIHLPLSALIVTAIINGSLFVQMAASDNPTLMAMSLKVLIISIVLLMFVSVQFRYFRSSVRAQASLVAANRHNSQLANHDSLTGLANRRRFFAELETAMGYAQKHATPLAIGIVDLDGFKAANDLHGHHAGDNLLIEASQRLAAILGDKIFVSRLGGDEFAVLIKDENKDELIKLGESICAVMRVPFEIGDIRIVINATVGIAVCMNGCPCVKSLYEHADYALFEGKRNNPGHAMYFDEAQATEIAARSKLEQTLLKADRVRELDVMFQPIIDISNNEVVALEILARWESDELGRVSPAQFIPIAEQTGIIGEITQILLAKALSEARHWPKYLRLSFNLSSHDVCTPENLPHILRIVTTSGIDPSRIDFEITETAVLSNFDQAINSMILLKALGCGVALDDFGTGFSSLTHLHALPLTKIKIDRSFVTDIHKKPASYKIVRSLVSLARDMELGCVVEGIETAQEKQAIMALGTPLVQGYHWSAPLCRSQIHSALRTCGSARLTMRPDTQIPEPAKPAEPAKRSA